MLARLTVCQAGRLSSRQQNQTSIKTCIVVSEEGLERSLSVSTTIHPPGTLAGHLKAMIKLTNFETLRCQNTVTTVVSAHR